MDQQSSRLEAESIIRSLSTDLERLSMRSKMSSSQHSSGSGKSDFDEVITDPDLEFRITGKRSRERSSSRSSQQSSATLSLNLTPKTQISVETFKSPLSPTKAGICMTNQLLGRPPRSASTNLKDHQIYFDMDASVTSVEDDSFSWSNDFASAKKWSHSSATPASDVENKNMNQSCGEDSSGVSSSGTLEGFHPTHRATHQFIPRHDDEILLDVGDPVYVEHEAEDLWFSGINLRTGQRGIFPVAYAFEIDFEEECGPMSSLRLKLEDKATFYLTSLGSVEIAHHKGNDVLVQSINKILNFYQNKEEIVVPRSVLLDVSFRGIHVIDKSRKNWFQCPQFDYFYSLQNISFCGAHPKQLRYFGFVTKHPLLPRFACHVFLSNGSTQPIVDAIGRAFKRSYDEYMAFAHPTEDIFMDS